VRILALPKYGPKGASSRLRFLQYFSPLQAAGLTIEQHALLSDEALLLRYQTGRYSIIQLLKSYASRIQALLKRGRFDLLWVEKEALPWLPLWFELLMLRGVPYVLDYDDAIFHHYDNHRLKWVRKLYGRRIDGLMANATLVVAGNRYLAKRAQDAGAPWVELLPTVIDLERYPNIPMPKASKVDGLPRIVWVGSPSTARYLELLQEPLQQLAQRLPFMLRVVGGKINIPGVQVEIIEWSEASEVHSISTADVGVMPLTDSLWEKGKCGYKLIQYMACSLPVVASPIGVNTEIVEDGANGFLAVDTTAWVTALEQLLTQPNLAMTMGQSGRRKVENEYCLQVTATKLERYFIKIATSNECKVGHDS
jgi:glycosyltransferase involved in cell wall biosynthesis